jgi:hypothetical protein
VREAEAIYRERGHEVWTCVTLLNECAYLLELKNADDAWKAVREALEMAVLRDDAYLITPAIGHIARIAAERGNAAESARLLGFVDEAYRQSGTVREPTEQRGYEELLEMLRGSLEEERVTRLLAEGAHLDREAAVHEAQTAGEPA